MSNRKFLLKAFDIASMSGEERRHFLNPNAKRIRKSIGDSTGLFLDHRHSREADQNDPAAHVCDS